MSSSSTSTTTSTCPIDDKFYLTTESSSSASISNSAAAVFETTLTIERFHDWSPRFGKSSNIQTHLILGSKQQQSDYLKGLLAASTAVFCLVVLWVIIMLVMNCCCSNTQTTILWTGKRPKINRPKQPSIDKPKQRKQPFQQGGVAGVAAASSSSSQSQSQSSSLSTKIKDKIQAAREKKRRLEEQHHASKKKKYGKMDDTLDDILEEGNENNEGGNAKASSSSETPLETALRQQNGVAIISSSSSDPIIRSPGTVPTTSISHSDGDGNNTIGGSTTHDATTTFTGGGESHGASTATGVAAEIESEKLKRQTWDNYYEAMENYQKECDRQALKVYRIRLVLIICFVGIIISATLFMVMGILGLATVDSKSNGGLAQSVAHVKNGLNQLSTNCMEAINVIDDYQQRQVQTLNSTAKFILEVNEICPNQTSSLCTDVTSDIYRQCDFTVLPNPQLSEKLTDLLDLFTSTTQLVFGSLDELESDLEQLIVYLDKADTYYPKHFSWAFWVSAGSSIGLAGLCLYLLTIVIRLICYTETEMASAEDKKQQQQKHLDNDDDDDDGSSSTTTTQNNNSNDILPVPIKGIRSWLVLPLFVLLAIISWIFSMVFIAGSIGTSDLCINSPDGPMQSIMENIVNPNFASPGSSILYFFLSYYIHGCPAIRVDGGGEGQTMAPTTTGTGGGSSYAYIADPAMFELEQRFGILSQRILPAMDALIQVLSDSQTQAEMQAICSTSQQQTGGGRNYLLAFVAITEALQDQFCVLTQTLDDLRMLFSCDNWHPIYVETVHNAICYSASSGLSWASATQFVIVVLVLIVLTLRVGYYEFSELIHPSSAMCRRFCCFGGGPKHAQKMADDNDDDEKSTSEEQH